MFEALTEKLNAVFSRFNSKGRLTERDVDEGLREVRLALLEADVNFRVARDFVQRVRERTVGSQVMVALSPGQQIVKIVHEELTAILGGESPKLANASQPPTVVMLAGLQGTGKTTTAAKLALHFKKAGQRALLVAGDLRRPAAVEQVEALARQLDVSREETAEIGRWDAKTGMPPGYDSVGAAHKLNIKAFILQRWQRGWRPSPIGFVPRDLPQESLGLRSVAHLNRGTVHWYGNGIRTLC